MRPQREVGISLTSISIGNFTDTKDLRSMNRVRSHLGVVYVSDVCSTDERKMDNRLFATTYTSKYRNAHDWPENYHMTKVDYTAWLKLFKTIFRSKNNTLPVSLGSCIQISTVNWVGNWD